MSSWLSDQPGVFLTISPMDYKMLITAMLICYILGIATGLLTNKQNIKVETTMSIILSVVWLSAQIYKIAFGADISSVFDIVGAGAMGNLTGLNILELVRSVRNPSKKNETSGR